MYLNIINISICTFQVIFLQVFLPRALSPDVQKQHSHTRNFQKAMKIVINLCFIMEKKLLFSQSSHTVTFTHLACSWRSFSWACLSKLASCPCVEHAHQTSSTLPVWHMHARHVQWHPHNKLATERINFPVHYSTDVCFNFFLMERLWYSIIRQKSKHG